MPSERSTTEDWKAVAAMLLTHREEQLRTWGATDDLLVARFLAGDCDAQERAQVETWMQEYPAVRELVELSRLSLNAEQGADAVVVPAAAASLWQQSRGAVAQINETISAWINESGDFLVQGLQNYIVNPEIAISGRTLDEAPQQQRQWDIPLPPVNAVLTLRLAFASVGEWLLELSTSPPLAEARLELSRSGEAELSDRLANWEHKAMTLDAGEWIVKLQAGEHVWQLPLVIGSRPL